MEARSLSMLGRIRSRLPFQARRIPTTARLPFRISSQSIPVIAGGRSMPTLPLIFGIRVVATAATERILQTAAQPLLGQGRTPLVRRAFPSAADLGHTMGTRIQFPFLRTPVTQGGPRPEAIAVALRLIPTAIILRLGHRIRTIKAAEATVGRLTKLRWLLRRQRPPARRPDRPGARRRGT